jgi:hypothetical protein
MRFAVGADICQLCFMPSFSTLLPFTFGSSTDGTLDINKYQTSWLSCRTMFLDRNFIRDCFLLAADGTFSRGSGVDIFVLPSSNERSRVLGHMDWSGIRGDMGSCADL